MSETTATMHGTRRQRAQFGVSKLLLAILLPALATHQIMSPEWFDIERRLLAAWIIGWLLGLAYGRLRGKRGILSATVIGSLSGIAASLVLFLCFRQAWSSERVFTWWTSRPASADS